MGVAGAMKSSSRRVFSIVGSGKPARSTLPFGVKGSRSSLAKIEGSGQVVFRYAEGTNPNGSINDIAAVMNDKGNVLGMMPHPENLIEAAHGGSDGRGLFASALEVIAA